ncbi:MAG: cyclic nucleotide-binding domain-containing protein [Bacteroidota bacterium]
MKQKSRYIWTMYQAVIDSLQSFGTFSEKDLSFFESKLSARAVRKNDFVLKEKGLCQAIYFLLDGSCIHMLPSANGTDTVVNLYTKHSWLTDYQSFTSQKPSVAFIQAFEDCQLAVLEIHALHELIQYSPIFFKAGKLLEMMQYTDITSLTLSPEERYRDLIDRRPELLQTFPLKILASYLRITPETLSRIRKRIQ